MRKRCISYGAVSVIAAACLFAQTPTRVQTFPLRDTNRPIGPEVMTEAVTYLSRKCFRITSGLTHSITSRSTSGPGNAHCY
jgi:hypothetical protein